MPVTAQGNGVGDKNWLQRPQLQKMSFLENGSESGAKMGIQQRGWPVLTEESHERRGEADGGARIAKFWIEQRGSNIEGARGIVSNL